MTNSQVELTRALALDNSIWSLIIMPTEKCNFRCEYCHEDFKIGRMPRAIVDTVKLLIQKRLPVYIVFQLVSLVESLRLQVILFMK